MLELLLAVIALTLCAGVVLLYRLSTAVPALRVDVKSIQEAVETEIRKARNYPDWRNPAFPLRSVRHYADLVVRHEEILDKHERDLEDISQLEPPTFLPKLKYEGGRAKFADYNPTEDVKALMKKILEARYDRSAALWDLEFIIQVNLAVQRGELTIAEADRFDLRKPYDAGKFSPEGEALIAAEYEAWLTNLTVEGRERRMQQAREQKYEPTPRQSELDKLWGEKFKFRPNLSGIRFGISRYYAVKLTD